ncbi:MAG: hypothetical protein LQ350_004560 [Teloschistes chrysophthalmus]|nr:MAG: hypothetical protein LQ350_004560 [Niorma chrysophthalma]
MASNVFPRFLPTSTGSPSIYETLRQHDESSDQSDVEERAALAVDEENLAERFQDYELDDPGQDIAASQADAQINLRTTMAGPKLTGSPLQQRIPPPSSSLPDADEPDDEVPPSLLIEDNDNPASPLKEQQPRPIPSPLPGPGNRATRAKWLATQEQQQLHSSPRSKRGQPAHFSPTLPGLAMADPRERAMWRWANVEDLDNFLRDVYDYFLGNGIWCILLSRLLNLLTLAFVVGFSTFLTSCIDFGKIRSSHTMSEILIPRCTKNMSSTANLLIWLFAFFWIGKSFQYLLDIRRLRNMHNFYRYLLDIPDTDIQTVSWQEIVKRLMALRDSNPATAAGISERHRRFTGSQSKQRMDAHDIANRLMRRDNYLIALINKDVLDLTLPLPFLKQRQLFSKTLEWNLSFCILDFVFNEHGQVRPLFLKGTHRRALSEGIRSRFLFAGFMNFVCAPFIIIYFIMLYFFRYFNEYQKNPSQIGTRQYTPYAQWKFREFNELQHLFQRRANMSYPFASRYIDQFPKDKSIQLSRFVAFIAGALASILFLASIIDPELFLGFEITHDRTVLFYLGVFTSIWAVARGAVPEENLVFDPEYALTNVIEYTHYLPSHWRGRLHSDEVRSEFALLYRMKVMVFFEEILGIIITPLILWFSLPKCSDRLVDFFREFTVHVDGLGHVCSFAVFDFQKGPNNVVPQEAGADADLRNDYYATKDGKMLASYYGFMDNYVTNQKAGAPFLHQPNRRHFHPPPSFPGLMSPALKGEGIEQVSGTSPRPRAEHGRQHVLRTSAATRSAHRTPRFGPSGSQTSPVASILLDPQHQPTPSGLRSSYRPVVHSRLRSSRRPLTDPAEDDEDALLENPVTAGDDLVDDITGENSLGESWKTTRAAAVDDNNEGHQSNATRDRGPGVLGLVYQFSKAQTGARGAGAII